MRGMMKLGVFGLGLCLMMSATATERGDPAELYRKQSPDDLIINYMQRHNVPSMEVAIVQAPYIPRIVGFGLSDVKTKRLAASKTLYALGQMTEGYTDVAIMQLVEQGKIRLTDTISQYVPDVPPAWRDITLKHLMAHTSGIPEYQKAGGFRPAGTYKPKELIELVKGQHLLFRPGTNASHSATNFVLLGMVIEKASGMSYENFIKKYQFKPLNLQHTFFISEVDKIDNEVNKGPKPLEKHKKFLQKATYINPTEMATGYIDINGSNVETKPFSASAYFANGSIVASAEDVSIWDVGLAGNILIKEKSNRDFLYSAIKLADGTFLPAHGRWQFPGHKGLMYIKGYAPGFSAYLDRFTAPDELLCVTLLANKANLPDLAILARQIGAAYQTALATPQAADWTVIRQSPYSVTSTVARITDVLKKHNVNLFARVDQSKQAEDVGMKLTPTVVLLFGNPKVGTEIMQKQPILSLMLPVRVTVFENNKGEVWVAYPELVKLANKYGIKEDQLKPMYKTLSSMMLEATTPY